MSEPDNETVIVRDRASRRQFIRRGAAFVAVGGLMTNVTQTAYADDCDRNQGEGKNAQAPGSDSDAGESADPTGCGKQPAPKISSNPHSLDFNNNVSVEKIKA